MPDMLLASTEPLVDANPRQCTRYLDIGLTVKASDSTQRYHASETGCTEAKNQGICNLA